MTKAISLQGLTRTIGLHRNRLNDSRMFHRGTLFLKPLFKPIEVPRLIEALRQDWWLHLMRMWHLNLGLDLLWSFAVAGPHVCNVLPALLFLRFVDDYWPLEIMLQSTACCFNAFQWLTTLWLNENLRTSSLSILFCSFSLCPLYALEAWYNEEIFISHRSTKRQHFSCNLLTFW